MPGSLRDSCCASVRRFHKSLKYSHTQHRKPSNTSRNSTTVYRQEAAGRLAEIRQLESAHTGSNKSRFQKSDSMSSKAQQAKNQQANQSIGQYPAMSSQHAVEPSGRRATIPQPLARARQKFNTAPPENRLGRINPRAEEANTTPGTTHEK